MTSGQYFNKGETWYVGGSPRALKLLGQVVLFQFPFSTMGSLVEYAASPSSIQCRQPQFGSYFGSVLLSANVNRDSLGLDELFVGAPFYDTDVPDQGAVFVFYRPSYV